MNRREVVIATHQPPNETIQDTLKRGLKIALVLIVGVLAGVASSNIDPCAAGITGGVIGAFVNVVSTWKNWI